MATPKPCVFCAIVAQTAAGANEADVVLDEPQVLAFLDYRPVFPGHVLVIPKDHYPTLAELPPALFDPLFGAVQRLSVAVPEAVGATGTFVANNNIVSQSVPHLHVHVVPRKPKDGLRGFFWPRVPYPSDEARSHTAAAIRAVLEATSTEP